MVLASQSIRVHSLQCAPAQQPLACRAVTYRDRGCLGDAVANAIGSSSCGGLFEPLADLPHRVQVANAIGSSSCGG